MKQLFYLMCAATIVLTGCKEGFKKTSGSYEFKLVGGGSGKKVMTGEFLQLDFKNWIEIGSGDSVLQNTRDGMPQIVMVDSSQKEVYSIYKNLRKGDSAVVRIIADTMFKKMGRDMPSFFRKGKYLYTSIKVRNVYSTQQEAMEADRIEREKAKPKMYKLQIDQIEKDLLTKKADIERDSKIIADYLAKNNIKATKAPWGTFIVFENEGTGDKINSESVVGVNYTGRTLDSGVVFDSNTDPKFGHIGAYPVDMSQPVGSPSSVIIGWTDALMQMKNGAKAKIYIPSSLGYGTTGSGANIKPNANLVFDIEVKSVMSGAEAAAKQQAEQKIMQEQQQRYMDSLQKAAAGKKEAVTPKN